jgi:hypothetical protein
VAGDFRFYATYGTIVTRSVQVAPVLRGLAYLVVPVVAGLMVGGALGRGFLEGDSSASW